MTKLLVSKDNPGGYKLEDIIRLIRKDILSRCLEISDDEHEDIQLVISNNMHILSHLEQIISHAENSTEIMTRYFGKSQG